MIKLSDQSLELIRVRLIITLRLTKYYIKSKL